MPHLCIRGAPGGGFLAALTALKHTTMEGDDGRTYKYIVVRMRGRGSPVKIDLPVGDAPTKGVRLGATSDSYTDVVSVCRSKADAVAFARTQSATGSDDTYFAVAKVQFVAQQETLLGTTSRLTPLGIQLAGGGAKRARYMVTFTEAAPGQEHTLKHTRMGMGSGEARWDWASTASDVRSPVLITESQEEAIAAAKQIEAQRAGWMAIISKIESQITQQKKRRLEPVDGAETAGEDE